MILKAAKKKKESDKKQNIFELQDLSTPFFSHICAQDDMCHCKKMT